MAKNISLMGALYSDVPAVTLPQTGGGIARFDDASVTTAVASDVAQGKVFLAADGTITTGTGTGGSGDGYVWQDADGYVHLSDEPGTQTVVEPLSVTQNGTYTAQTGHAYSPVTVNVSGGGTVERSDVNFYDYDGTLLHSFTTAEVNESGFALPSNPSHTGLTAQGWNWTLAEIKAQLTAMPTQPVDVGQLYITDDGKTRLYCRFEEGRLHPYLGIGVNGTVVVDWGDGSATSTLTGSSLTTAQVADHVYASGGDYMITLTVSSGSVQIIGNANTTYLLRKGNSTTSYIHRVYSNDLVKVELGTGLNIGDYAFCYCYSLTSITIPSEVTSIGTYAFSSCYALTSITMPSGVSNIGNSMFQNCYTLTSITIPSEVTSIGTYAFSGCHALTSITIPSGVTSIGTYAFSSCYVLASITIPSEVTSIGTYAFSSCYALTSITIPNGVTSIGTNAFSSCYALTSITIPNGVTSIGTYAFSSCHSLASITIPSGVTSIGNSMFQNCHSLASITIPSEVTSIGTSAFASDYGLGEIHFKPTTPPTVANRNAWGNIPTDCKIYVPTGTLSAYTSASNYPSSSTYAYIEE